MIEIQNLNKKYIRKNILSNISLLIPNGVYGLLGEQRAGKTTLLKILATLTPYTKGNIQIFNYDIRIQKKLIRKYLGYQPQDFDFFPNMTVYESMTYLQTLKGKTPDHEYNKNDIQNCLSHLMLWKEKDIKVKDLTKSMKQRFGIAQAFLGDPKVVLLDEPTTYLTNEEKTSFLNLISKIQDDRIIIMATKDIHDISASCKNFAVISEGGILFNGSKKQYTDMMEEDVYTILVKEKILSQVIHKVNVISINRDKNKDNVRVRYMNLSQNEIKLNKLSKKVQPNIFDAYVYQNKLWLRDEG